MSRTDESRKNLKRKNSTGRDDGHTFRLPPIKSNRNRDEEYLIRSLKLDSENYKETCDIEKLLQERRKLRHEKVLENMAKAMKSVTAETENHIFIHSQKLSAYLKDSCNEIECGLRNLKSTSDDPTLYVSINKNVLTDLTECMFKVNESRRIEINEHYKYLVRTEKKRIEKFKFILRHAYKKICLIYYSLPSEIEDYFEKEIARLNEITLNNFHCYSELKKELILKIENDMRQWMKDLEGIKNDLREYYIKIALDNITGIKSVQIQSKQNLKMIDLDYDKFIASHGMKEQRPRVMNESEVESWWSNAKEVFTFLDFRARELIELYKDAIVCIFNRVFDTMKNVTENLVNSGLADQIDIAYIRKEFLKPTLKNLTLEYSTDIKEMQNQWDDIVEILGSKIRETYSFLKQAADLWVNHEERMTEAKILVAQQMRQTMFKCCIDLGIIYRRKFKDVDQARIFGNEYDLKRGCETMRNKTHNEIKKAYNQATDKQSKVAQKLKDLSDVEVLYLEIKDFIETYANLNGYPHESRGTTPSSASRVLCNEMQSCEVQIQAVENWMYGLWNSLKSYLKYCKEEKTKETIDWVEHKVDIVKKRGERNQSSLKNKFKRFTHVIYSMRLAEIKYHDSRMERHRAGIEDEMILAEEELETYKKKIEEVLEEYNSFIEETSVKLRSSTASGIILQQLKASDELSYTFVDKPSHLLEEYRESCKKRMNKLRKSNLEFLKAMKLFSEDGCYSPAECKAYSIEIKALQKAINKRFTNLLKAITIAQSNMTNQIATKKKEYSDIIHKYQEECEYTDRAVSKLNRLQGKLVDEADNAKKIKNTVRAYKDEFKRVAALNIKNFQYVDQNIKNLQDIMVMINEATKYFVHPEPINNCFMSLESNDTGVGTSAESSKQNLDSFKSYRNYLFKTPPQQDKTYLSNMFNLIYESYMELENYAKDFYTNHKSLLLKSLKIQPNYDAFIEESLAEYKKYQLQCEISWMELVHLYLLDILDLYMFIKDFCDKYSRNFKQHNFEVFAQHQEVELGELKRNKEEIRREYMKIHGKLKPLHGHHNNKHLLERLQEEMMDVTEYTKSNEVDLEPIEVRLEELITDLDQEVTSFDSKVNCMNDYDYFAQHIKKLRDNLEKVAEEFESYLQLPSLEDDKTMAGGIHRRIAKYKMEVGGKYRKISDSHRKSMGSMDLNLTRSAFGKLLVIEETFFSQMFKKYREVCDQMKVIKQETDEVPEYFNSIWQADVQRIRNLYKVKYDLKPPD